MTPAADATRTVILTVDDDPGVSRSVARDLRRRYGASYRIVRAESGPSALDALRELKLRGDLVAVILADYRMPQMNGIEFLEQALDVYPGARRVLLTAYADTNAAIDAINVVDLDHYLLKPWDPPEEKLYPVLDDLLTAIKNKQNDLQAIHHKYVPVAVKIAPDLSVEELIQVADSLVRHNIDGVIATNTTLDRSLVQGMKNCDQMGGLSGRPLQLKSTEIIRQLSQELKGQLPIIGVGGIDSVIAAREKIAAGATLVQIYSGFIFKGPPLIKEIVSNI